MTIQELESQINQFFLDSEKETDDKGTRHLGVYPNAVMMTDAHYKEFLRELFHTEEDALVVYERLGGRKLSYKGNVATITL